MKGAEVHLVQIELDVQIGKAVRDARGQLARGLVGEGDDKQRLRRDAFLRDEIDDALDQREGLAGAGARDDEHRAFGGEDGFELLWVGLGLEGGRASRHSTPLAVIYRHLANATSNPLIQFALSEAPCATKQCSIINFCNFISSQRRLAYRRSLWYTTRSLAHWRLALICKPGTGTPIIYLRRDSFSCLHSMLSRLGRTQDKEGVTCRHPAQYQRVGNGSRLPLRSGTPVATHPGG